MNNKQWDVLGIGLIFMAIFLFSAARTPTSVSSMLYVYSSIFCGLGIIFFIIGFLEDKKK